MEKVANTFFLNLVCLENLHLQLKVDMQHRSLPLSWKQNRDALLTVKHNLNYKAIKVANSSEKLLKVSISNLRVSGRKILCNPSFKY